MCSTCNARLVKREAEQTALIEERDRLRFVINMIAESVVVSVVGTPTDHRVVWGCGICQGEADGRGTYAHKYWCPRK